jgi:molybdopterin converting factor small subunit
MKIKILRLGHSATEVDTPNGATVQEALEGGSLPFQGYSISVNGMGAGLSTVITDGDLVTLVPKVEGGR